MNSKVYYGTTFFTEDDLKESEIHHKIELEYYKTYNNNQNNPYGIEVVKKEYNNLKPNIEINHIYNLTNNNTIIDNILQKLKDYKVTPITLKDVVEDLSVTFQNKYVD